MGNTRGEVVLNDRQEIEVATSAWKDFLSLIKIGIVNSNLITTFTGIWLALYFSGKGFLENIDIVVFTLLGTAAIIAGSCAINNFYDRDIDHVMERTRLRPTVTGRISSFQVLLLGTGFISIGTILLLMVSVSAAVIGLLGVFSYIVLYTMWTKRQYTINTVVGSIAGAVPPLIGWAAVDDLNIIAWILFLIMFIWQPPHFLALAMKRSEEYRKAGIPMLPVVHGFEVTKRQIIVWVACLLPLPFYLFSLGIGFIVLATVLNIIWLILSLIGLKMKNDLKWSKWMFIYSINYLTILFVAMVAFSII
ncbi:MAG: protoheme IX farnesyltransferase [Bacillaceae bacterium]|uniref:Protoheme IX farnesyltransferase n=2 Tax=Aeribacillus TaxID=1055323 RepID=A0A165XAD7_9BACI|nr:protoheme IX farnesyltransferase [Aeribacillus pallidus]REJ20430.1 MAG: protoheme IX farnesyltransferase [Bacillaceae bacterium]TVZ83133.1 protoheme IX farnesyltransferase [Aeribacillus composti]KZM52648.1 protoheme IX farnesyltransferase [Aeribacillus pallidus]KZN95796.1 protoheme IX farnesyltransferase [Aeribacillus pallidus]